METRALAIALFYAVGTAAGGIAGPVLFGQMIHSGEPDKVAIGFFIGAAAMTLGGVAELRFGVRAEQRSLEDIAPPAHRARVRGRRRGRERTEAERRPPGTSAASAPRAPAARAQGGAACAGPAGVGGFHSPAMAGTAGTPRAGTRHPTRSSDREIEALARVLAEQGELDRARLEQMV